MEGFFVLPFRSHRLRLLFFLDAASKESSRQEQKKSLIPRIGLDGIRIDLLLKLEEGKEINLR